MRDTNHVSKRKGRKEVLPALGVVGMSLSLAGGASAAAVPAVDTPARPIAQVPEITLNEEEVSDVSLATFYVFDKENAGTSQLGTRVAGRCGCGGRGCGGRGCGGRGCGGRGCGGWGGCGGCGGCGCCTPWRPWLCV